MGFGTKAGWALGVSIFSAATSVLSICASGYLSYRALANASPHIAIVAEVGTLDPNDKFTQIAQRTFSIGDIRNGRDWLKLTFTNGGGREIRIEQVGIATADNDGVFTGAQIPSSAATAPCGDNSIKALVCPGSTPFNVKPSEGPMFYYPLFAGADWLAGAIGDRDDEKLNVAYKSFDVDDHGRKVDTFVKITP